MRRNEFARRLYNSYAWQRCRASYIASVGGLCERCLARGLIVAGEHVHHKVHLTAENVNDPDVALNPANLELLCAACHTREHSGAPERRTDELGRVPL